jgi:hypothetical protein
MTALSKRIVETPMAPYMDLLKGMTEEDKKIVITFIADTMQKPAEVKSNKEIIREKFKNLKLSDEIKQMRGCIKLSDEDLKDERIQYILNR